VRLGQDVHPQVGGKAGEVRHLLQLQCLGNQEYRVGPGRTGLVHLDRVDDELLAQQGQVHGRPDLPQVVDGAAEEPLVR